jgi:hypothetical protein
MKIENEIRYLELPQEYSPRLWNAKSACAGWRAPSGVNLSAIPPRRYLTGVDFLASPCVPSPVSAIRTPKLPLLPVWEKGVGGKRGNRARECRKPGIAPKNAPFERGRPRTQAVGERAPRVGRRVGRLCTVQG